MHLVKERKPCWRRRSSSSVHPLHDNTLLQMLRLVLRSHPSWGLFKNTVKLWSLAVSGTWWRQKRNLQLRGETSALLMRRTAVRQSPSSLCLWCLSMLNTHSMIQNILKYRTVIIDLQNTHPHVLGICILLFFLMAGGLGCLGGKTV